MLTLDEAATNAGHADSVKAGLTTLAVDVGGTGIKAAILNDQAVMVSERVRVGTPHPCPPDVLIRTIVDLVRPLPAYERVSIGFPGYVRRGLVFTAPNLDSEQVWSGYPLASELEKTLGRPVRLMNDAEVQGLGLIAGKGIEVVLTFGTGMGSAIFQDGGQTPHLELGHHPLRRDLTYDEYVGNEARKAIGPKKWSKRVRRIVDVVAALTHFDVLYLGGGNAKYILFEPPPGVRVMDNQAGVTGGVRLWADGARVDA